MNGISKVVEFQWVIERYEEHSDTWRAEYVCKHSDAVIQNLVDLLDISNRKNGHMLKRRVVKTRTETSVDEQVWIFS